MWSKLCGRSYVVEAMWSKLCGRSYVVEAMWRYMFVVSVDSVTGFLHGCALCGWCL